MTGKVSNINLQIIDLVLLKRVIAQELDPDIIVHRTVISSGTHYTREHQYPGSEH